MRLIDADRLKKTLVIMANKCGGSLDILDISDAIEKAPTLERPRGEWIKTYYSIDGVGASRFKCSKCEKEISKYGKPYNFCPNCGSDNRPKEGE